jgi:hypothetical protein
VIIIFTDIDLRDQNFGDYYCKTSGDNDVDFYICCNSIPGKHINGAERKQQMEYRYLNKLNFCTITSIRQVINNNHSVGHFKSLYVVSTNLVSL